MGLLKLSRLELSDFTCFTISLVLALLFLTVGMGGTEL